MPELAEVAIELALLARAKTFATAQSLTIGEPNAPFTPPDAKSGSPTVYGKYLRASFLPAPSVEIGIAFNAHLQHYGLMQLDCFIGADAGEPAVARIAAAVIAYFARGTEVSKDGFRVRVTRAPYRGPMIVDGAWAFIPVSIPYLCFARPA